MSPKTYIRIRLDKYILTHIILIFNLKILNIYYTYIQNYCIQFKYYFLFKMENGSNDLHKEKYIYYS